MLPKLHTLTQSLFLALFFVFGLVYVHGAWNEPTQSAPNGNTDAPINVGGTDQIKSGGLGVDSLAVYGNAAVTGDIDVTGYMKVGESSVACDGTMAGAIRYDSVNKEMQYCDTTEWVKMASTTVLASGGDTPAPLYGGVHTDEECLAAGGLTTPHNSEQFCRFLQSSCPAGWTRYQNLGTTQARSCNGNGCGRGSSCTTGSHIFSNVAPETCAYAADYMRGPIGRNDNYYCEVSGNLTCTATVTSVGCY